MDNRIRIEIPHEKLAEFCQKWKVQELSLFGSVLREDFGPDSDIDILVSFAPGADWSLLDHIRMEEELEAILGHKVDIVTRRAIERSANWIRRKAILESAVQYYVER
ncbi:MAG TPA: nucleotidyltransferase family protein [Candidatus Hypogeohydataceae bacterium YC41]